jgi:hypothetical protein
MRNIFVNSYSGRIEICVKVKSASVRVAVFCDFEVCALSNNEETMKRRDPSLSLTQA